MTHSRLRDDQGSRINRTHEIPFLVERILLPQHSHDRQLPVRELRSTSLDDESWLDCHYLDRHRASMCDNRVH